MMAGQYVTRVDGTRWQIAEIRTGHHPQKVSASLRPVETTVYHLVRPDQAAHVEVWGAGAAEKIGHHSEQLRLDPDQNTPIERTT